MYERWQTIYATYQAYVSRTEILISTKGFINIRYLCIQQYDCAKTKILFELQPGKPTPE